jgi:hypothetical protein
MNEIYQIPKLETWLEALFIGAKHLSGIATHGIFNHHLSQILNLSEVVGQGKTKERYTFLVKSPSYPMGAFIFCTKPYLCG